MAGPRKYSNWLIGFGVGLGLGVIVGRFIASKIDYGDEDLLRSVAYESDREMSAGDWGLAGDDPTTPKG